MHQETHGDYCMYQTNGFPLTVFRIEYQYRRSNILGECGWEIHEVFGLRNTLLFTLNVLIFSAAFFMIDVVAQRTKRKVYLLIPFFVFVCWLFA